MSDIHNLWLEYNKAANRLSAELGRTKNAVGEYAEHLANQYYKGTLNPPSHSGIDLEGPDGTLYQVKARKVSGNWTTSLGIIRSSSFNYLVVIFFDSEGGVVNALQVPRDVAEEYAKSNKHQNGKVISTTKKFRDDPRNIDITEALKALQA